MKKMIRKLAGGLGLKAPSNDASAQSEVGEPSFSEKLNSIRDQALIDGGGMLMPYNNVAPGTYGYALYQLEFDGLMSKRTEIRRVGPIETVQVTIFELTQAGRIGRSMMVDEPV